MSESKPESGHRRRLRPVRTASGEVRADSEPVGRRHWWWIGTALLLALILIAAGAGQWWYGWVDSLPHSTVTRAAITVPAQPAAAAVALASSPAAINEAAVAAALRPYLGAKGALGPHVDVLVTGLSGSPAFRSGTGPITPASTLKLLTATAALETLGPQARFSTVVRRTGSSTITLVGGGDPYLATKASSKAGYPKRATLADLAARTAKSLKAQHITRVRLDYDSSLFAGPALSPSWEPGYFPSGVIAPISALWTNEGHLPNGGVSADPPASAAQTFAGLLRAKGIAVMGRSASVTAAPTAPEVARVTSAPLVDELAETLTESDNFAAEVIARHVARATGHPASFDGAVTGIETTLKRLGIPVTGLVMHDGSGLSRHDRLEPATLAAALRLAVTTPRLAGLLTDLPVAGFDGSLTSRFEKTSSKALGLVRAKTGTLTGVHSMAGFAVDATGNPLIFVALADEVQPIKTLDARDVLDRIGAALATCRCTMSP
ncbi:MAG: D-alanyl-D-alanine carboxypeptidase/D-alanyl-D-alanine endopeptidase [Marmoricola sp.]